MDDALGIEAHVVAMVDAEQSPLSVSVEGDSVLVDGPGVAITLTAIAAADLSDALLKGACEARGQALKSTMPANAAAPHGG